MPCIFNLNLVLITFSQFQGHLPPPPPPAWGKARAFDIHTCPLSRAFDKKRWAFDDQQIPCQRLTIKRRHPLIRFPRIVIVNKLKICYLKRISVLEYLSKQHLGLKMPLCKLWSRDGRSRKAIRAANFKNFVLKGKFGYNLIFVK